MQNFLREQSEDLNSVNMVFEIATFLYDFSKKQVINIDILQLFNQLLQALKEFCTGNYKNREIAFNANVVSVINYVLQIDITKISKSGHKHGAALVANIDQQLESMSSDQKTKENIDYIQLRRLALEMKVAAVGLLDALLEEITNKASKLPQQIAEGLDMNALHWSMLDFYDLKGDQDLIDLEVDDDAYRALFDCYKVVVHLVDIGIAPLETLSEYNRSINVSSNHPTSLPSRAIEVTR